jgi:iron complex transport system substrate-binding protein
MGGLNQGPLARYMDKGSKRRMKSAIGWIAVIIFWMGPPAVAKTATDQLGRPVDLPDDPQRIVSLAPSITEIIFELNQGRRLIGVTQHSNYPAEASTLPKVGSYIRLDLEKIMALKPDLCIGIKDGNPKESVERLHSMKIPVYVVDPHNLETVIHTIAEIGLLLNASEHANRLVNKMRSRLEKVRSMVASTERRPRVFIQIGIAPIISVGSPTFLHDLIVEAGGINVAAGPSAYPRFSREEVLALAPDVIFITSMDRQAVFENVKADWSRWADMPAARDHRVFIVDSDLFDRPSPRLLDGLETLVQLIHPEMFAPTP